MEKVYYVVDLAEGNRISKVYQRKHAAHAFASHWTRGKRMSGVKEFDLVSPKRHRELLEAEAKLSALECAGVDNWCGYDEAMEWLEDA